MCLKAAPEVKVSLCFYNSSCIDENVKHIEKVSREVKCFCLRIHLVIHTLIKADYLRSWLFLWLVCLSVLWGFFCYFFLFSP